MGVMRLLGNGYTGTQLAKARASAGADDLCPCLRARGDPTDNINQVAEGMKGLPWSLAFRVSEKEPIRRWPGGIRTAPCLSAFAAVFDAERCEYLYRV